MVVDLAARDSGHLHVEEVDERAHDPTLRLSPLAEHDYVVAGYDGVRELRQNSFVVADDAGQERLAGAKARE